MTQEQRAAMQVFGYKRLPHSTEALKRKYRKLAKLTHPDSVAIKDSKAFVRVKKAHLILFAAIEQKNIPKIYVKFGQGAVKEAAVLINPVYTQDAFGVVAESKYVTTLKWYYGLLVRAENTKWKEIKEPSVFELSGVLIRCV
jgi:hypothetical protein